MRLRLVEDGKRGGGKKNHDFTTIINMGNQWCYNRTLQVVFYKLQEIPQENISLF